MPPVASSLEITPYLGGTGTRNVTSGLYGVFNLLPPGSEEAYILTDLFDPSGNSITVQSLREDVTIITNIGWESWTPIKPFIYRANSTTPPVLLRDEGYANYHFESARITGLVVFAVSSFTTVASIPWIAIHRNNLVLRAAQPLFLYPICVRSLLQSSCSKSFPSSLDFIFETNWLPHNTLF